MARQPIGPRQQATMTFPERTEALKSGIPKFVWRASVVCFIFQVAAIGVVGTYRFRTTDNHFAFGWEMGSIARSLALGHGFRDPFGLPTGPSAWEPPVYPYLIAGVFRVFGIYSNASAGVLEIINSLFTALTCLPIYLIARRTFDETVARWSSWTWALMPYFWYWSIHWVWDTTLSPLLLSLIFLVTLQLEEGPEWTGWILLGALWGVAALLNPSLVSFLPAAGFWACYRARKRGRHSLAGALVASLVFLAFVTPWLVRNYRVFGTFVFIRDDFGQQLRLGNGPGADGVSMVYLQPNLNVHELDRFRTLGELAYARERQREAFEFIRQHPARTAILDLKKLVYYWAGIPRLDDGVLVGVMKHALFLASSLMALWGLVAAVGEKRPGAWLFALLFVSYPTIYYLVYPHARYRHPIEPELLILALFLISHARMSSRLAPKA